MGRSIRAGSTRRPIHPGTRVVEFVRSLRGFEPLLARRGLPSLVAAKVHGPLTASALQQAAFRVQRRYPSLRARVVMTPPGHHVPCVEFCEARVGDFAFEEIRSEEGLPTAERAPWQRVLERELNRTLGPSADQALRVLWLPGIEQGGHVIVSARSALVDGTSLLLILHDLLEESAKLTAHPAGKRADAYALEPAPPSPCFLDAFPPRLRDRLRATLWGGLRRDTPRSDDVDCSLPDTGTLRAEGRVSVRASFAVGRISSARLRAACEAHRATLSGAALAAAEFAWMRLRTELGQRAPAPNARVRLELTMDFDCRKTRPATRSIEVGMLTGTADVGLEVTADIRFWQLAKALSSRSNLQFRRRIPLLFHQTLDGKLEIDSELHAFGLHGGAASGSAQALALSNLGPYPYATRFRTLELLELYSAQAALPFGPRVSLHLHELSDRTYYTLSAAQPACDASAGARLLAQIVELLERSVDATLDPLALYEHADLSRPR